MTLEGKRDKRRDQRMYVVADIQNDCLALEWTMAVYPDLAEARDEQLDAHEAGLSGQKIWELRPCKPLVSVPTPPVVNDEVIRD